MKSENEITKEQNVRDRMQAEEDEINLLDILLVLIRNKKMIIGSCAVTFVLACIVTLLMPNIYTGTARVLPPQKNNGGLRAMMGTMGGLASLAGVDVGGGSGELYLGMLQSRTIAEAIIERFGLMKRFEWETRSEAYEALKEKATFNLGEKDGIIQVSVEDKDPQLAADMANAYVGELRKLNVQLNLNSAGRDRRFLAERLSVVKADLKTAEERLKEFQQENEAIKLDEQAKTVIEAISRLKGELASKEVELGVLRSYQTDQNPRVKALREAIAQLKEQIDRMQRSSKGKGAEDVFIATSEVPELGLQYARLMRDFKVQETLYELVTKQYEMAKINEAKNTSEIQVLDQAFVPDRKSKPKRALIVILATFVVGLLTGFTALILDFSKQMEGEDRVRLQAIRREFRFWNKKKSEQ